MNPRPTILILAFATLMMLLACRTSNAQSLFDRRDARQMDFYSDITAKSRGALLVILINESTDVENVDARSLAKTGTSKMDGAVDLGLSGDLGATTGGGSYSQSGSGNRRFTGDTQFRSERQFLDRFTVTVVDVLPNGNLLVSGRRTIGIQGDVRTLQLTGIVRQRDIAVNNSVGSQLVGNLNIKLLAKGPEPRFSKQGWLGKKMNKFWPF